MKIIATFLTVFFTFNIGFSQTDSIESALQIWFDEPAQTDVPDQPMKGRNDPQWIRALPIGNGQIGAMIFGGVYRERLQLNEKSLWSGGPYDADNPEAFIALDEIRKLLWENRFEEAEQLTRRKLICRGKGSGLGHGANDPYGSFQTLGDLYITSGHKGNFSHYKRSLNLRDAIVTVEYDIDKIHYKREMFISYPDRVFVIRYSANEPKALNLELELRRPEKYTTRSDGNDKLIMFGQLNNGINGEGMRYMARLKAKTIGGQIKSDRNKLYITDADEVIILLTAATDYRLEYPSYCGRDFEKITQDNLDIALSKLFAELKQRHLVDYKTLFNKVHFSLSKKGVTNFPIDKRLDLFKHTQNDPGLYELYFQFGRYLLISSSRLGSLPANLQGIWNNKIQAPWNCDYHININIQMNYWPAELTNLSSCYFPFLDLIQSLQKPGARTAKIHYHARGWIVHPITNVWGFTAPGEQPDWGLHLGAGAWICSHLWEHYAYSMDKEYLNEIYPVLAGSVKFYLDWLVLDPRNGKLVSGPAGSPENGFLTTSGKRVAMSMGPTHDQELIWDLFTNFLEASHILGIDDSLTGQTTEAKKNLLNPQIGSDGRLMEWAEEYKEAEPGHRHISHLFALHPGKQISIEKTPELATAAEKSLEFRLSHGGGHTGWSAAWIVNLWARLGRGDDALSMFKKLLSKSTLPNLFDNHAPFQIDGNFGGTAGIAEMLIQSEIGIIKLLPALPKEWVNGEIKGLMARGAFEVDIKWQNSTLKKVIVHSLTGGKCTLKYGSKKMVINTEKGKTYLLDQNLRLIKF